MTRPTPAAQSPLDQQGLISQEFTQQNQPSRISFVIFRNL